MAEHLIQRKVFIATPGGLEDIRKAFQTTLQKWNDRVGLAHMGTLFSPVGWEITLPGKGRPQAKINEDLRRCDFFVLVLWNRWGSQTGKGDGTYSSGAEEEFHLALECIASDDHPMRDLSMFFKGVGEQQLADPGPQLSKVLAFKKRIESRREHLYQNFDTVEEFAETLESLLHEWARQPVADPPGIAIGDLVAPDGIDFEKGDSLGIDEAERLIANGNLVDAEVLLARAVAINPTDLEAITHYGHFLLRLGRLAAAEGMYRRVGELSKDGSRWKARAYGNIGIILWKRGELDLAEQMLIEALEISTQLADKEGMACQYGNLGLLHWNRGDLDQAERMHAKALEMFRILGRQKSMARQYGNLGNVYTAREDFDLARKMYCKALEIDELKADRSDGARQLGNLAEMLLDLHGSFDDIEEDLLAVGRTFDDLGHQEGLAFVEKLQGKLAHAQGHRNQAEVHFRKSLARLDIAGIVSNELLSTLDLLSSFLDETDRTEEAMELRERAAELRSQMGFGD